MRGKGDNLRVAESCESCKFSGFKAGYDGRKRVTGLCLRYRSTPEINYNFSASYFNSVVNHFHREARNSDTLEGFSFDEFIKELPVQYRPIFRIYLSYLIQKGRDEDLADIQKAQTFYYDYGGAALPCGRAERRTKILKSAQANVAVMGATACHLPPDAPG